VIDEHPARTATALRRLSRLPRLGVFLGTLALALAAFFTPGFAGAALVGLLAAGAAVLIAHTWNHRTPGGRALRLLVFAVLLLIAVSKVW
jgi:multisubunit Na+/H+ antiporter MnhB subunit